MGEGDDLRQLKIMSMPSTQDPVTRDAAIQALEAQRSLLGDAVVDAAIAALRKTTPTAVVSDDDKELFAGERKLVTVMFADLSGFTALSERLDPEEVRALINSCFDELAPIIQRYEGTIDKFIGDEIMALFGAPRAHERHAELACHAALALMEALTLFNRRRGTSLQVHIGINTGLVIAGGIGSEGRRQYSVMGDAVNLAARLKDAARPGEIFLGVDTQLLVASHFDFFLLPPLRLKGKAALVQVYGLQGAKSADMRDWNLQGRLRSPLVGREQELAMICEAINELRNKRGGRLALIAEAGLGKSRLVAEARQQAEGTTWLEGRALTYTRQNSYQLIVEMLRKLIGVTKDHSELEIRQGLQQAILQVAADRMDSILPYLASLLQLPLKESEVQVIQGLDAERLRQHIHLACQQLLQASAARQPVVLVWEDLHWADPSSLLLLKDLLDLPEEHPLLLILLFRPRTEERIWDLHQAARVQYEEGYQEIYLEALTDIGCQQLACHLLRVERLAPEVENLVQNKAEGNPFFVEELLRSLLDQGLLFLESLEIQATGQLNDLQLPTTLHGVIASRIDQLPAADKRLLQVASVLGRFFSRRVLLPLLGKVDIDLQPEPALQTLVQRGLIRQYGDHRQEEYVFHHAVTHEVTYQSLLLADRRHLHRLTGETMETLAGDAREEIAASLAMHFENAEEARRAVTYLQLAAGQAQRLFANEEAIGFYRRALKQMERLPSTEGNNLTWAELYEQVADILRPTGEYEAAIAHYAKAQQHLPTEQWLAHARLERKMGLAYNPSSQFDRMAEHYQQAIDLLQRETSTRSPDWWNEWIQVHVDQLMLFYWIDKADQMLALVERIKPDVEKYGTQEQRAQFISTVVGANFRLERYLLSEETITYARSLYENQDQIKDVKTRNFYIFMVGFTYLWYNDLNMAREILEEGLLVSEQTGDVILQSRYLTYLTVVYRRLGLIRETEETVQRSLAVSQQSKMQEYVATAYANFAWLAWKRRDLPQIEAYARRAYEGWENLPQTHASLVFAWTAAWPLAAGYFQQGKLADCVAQFEEILHPRRKRMEQELEVQLEQIVQAFRDDPTAITNTAMRQAFALAAKYAYL